MKRWLPAILLPYTLPLAAAITANTVEHFPYQYLANGELQGSLAETVDCINQQQVIPWKIEVTPWARALYNFREGSAQVLFPVYSAPENAELSPPLTIERWQWFALPDNTGTRIGAVRGSNEHEWLQRQHIPVNMLVTQPEQLLKLLSQGRIDRFVGDEKSVVALADQTGINIQRWQRRFIRFSPLFLAVRRDSSLAEQHLIQRATLTCAMASMTLTEHEKTLAIRLAQSLRDELDTLVAPALHGKMPSKAQIAKRDTQWHTTDFATHPHIDHSLNLKLTQWQTRHPAIREVIVMGARGETLAATPKPTDYWQGDEEKWLATLTLAEEDFLIEPIAFDQSTNQFIAHIGWPLSDNGVQSGAISLGIDIERLLSGQQDAACGLQARCPGRSNTK